MFEGFFNFPKTCPNCLVFRSLFPKAHWKVSPSLIFSSSVVTCQWLSTRWDTSPTSLSLTSWNSHLSRESSFNFAINLNCVCVIVWMFTTGLFRERLKDKAWAKQVLVVNQGQTGLLLLGVSSLVTICERRHLLFPQAIRTCGTQMWTQIWTRIPYIWKGLEEMAFVLHFREQRNWTCRHQGTGPSNWHQ